MKKSKNSGKLSLKKETIAQLSKSQFSNIVGGQIGGPNDPNYTRESWGLTTVKNCHNASKIHRDISFSD